MATYKVASALRKGDSVWGGTDWVSVDRKRTLGESVQLFITYGTGRAGILTLDPRASVRVAR